MNNDFNLILSLASINRPIKDYKEKLKIDRTYSLVEGDIYKSYYCWDYNLINDVVGSCVYYPKVIDYSNIIKISEIFRDNSELFDGKKLLIIDLRDNVSYNENNLIMIVIFLRL
jgi:hypothetical protein